MSGKSRHLHSPDHYVASGCATWHGVRRSEKKPGDCYHDVQAWLFLLNGLVGCEVIESKGTLVAATEPYPYFYDEMEMRSVMGFAKSIREACEVALARGTAAGIAGELLVMAISNVEFEGHYANHRAAERDTPQYDFR